ncbi:MAG: Trigger factor [Chlamydiae bacterium]|nr:Trigger factor [Chlamydiota bacterium]
MTSKTEEKTEKKEEYKNDQVQVVVKRKPNCIVEYHVHAHRPICVEAHKKAAKSVGKEVVIPGFRKGKAPPELVAKRYPGELDKRWQEGIANASYRESAQLANVPVIRQDANITFKMESHSRDGAKLILSFETAPHIPSIDPAKCVLSEGKAPEVSKEKVEETIRQTQMFFAKWEIVKDRPVKENDFLLLDVDVIEEEPEQKLFSNTRFEVSDKSMAQWMKKLVFGKKTGDVLEGMSEPDATLNEEEKKEFPPKKVRVTIKAIEEATLPELNDEFAKQVGAKSVDDLRTRIEELLNKKAAEAVREQHREQVTTFLFSNYFEIPSSVIEKETQFRLQQMIQDPQFKAKWDQSNNKEKQELIDNVKNQAEKAVRIFYLCRKIAMDQSISIEPKDMPLASSDPIEALLFPSPQHHDPRQPDVKQAEAYSRLLLEKTEDWIIAHARIGPPPKKAAEPKKEGKTEKKPAPKKKAAPKKTAAKTPAAKEEKPSPKPKRKSAPKKK